MGIFLTNHAVAKAVGGGRELDRHVGNFLEAVELAAFVEDLGDRSLLSKALHPVVQHDPLVVPSDDLAGFLEDIGRRVGLGREHIADRVVELEEGQMRLRHQKVFIVAMVADQGKAFGTAGQVVAEIACDATESDRDVLADQQFGSVLVPLGGIACVEMRAAVRAKAVDAIEVDAGVRKFSMPSGSFSLSPRDVRSSVMS